MNTIRIKLLPKQREFCGPLVRGRQRYAAYVGGVGSGKTWAGCATALLLSFLYPHNRGVVAAGTYRQLADTTRRQFFELLESLNLDSHVIRWHKSENRLVLASGSEVLFRSLEAYERLKSLNLGWFYIDEASEVREEAFPILQSRLRLSGAPFHCGFITSNPHEGWVRERFAADDTPPEYALVQAATEENRFLPEHYASDLRRAFGDAYARRYLDGQFGALDGMVYPAFSLARHVVPAFEPPPDWVYWRAIDFGWRNPFCCLFLAEDPQGTIHVVHEVYGGGRLLEEHHREIEALSGTRHYRLTVADHAAQERAELAALGLATVPADKEILRGILAVHRLMSERTADGTPRLVIHANCTNTIRELTRYRWAERNGNAVESPVKEDDHAMDALRYGVLARPRPTGPDLLTTAEEKRTPWRHKPAM